MCITSVFGRGSYPEDVLATLYIKYLIFFGNIALLPILRSFSLTKIRLNSLNLWYLPKISK